MCLSIAIHKPDHVLAKGEHQGFEWMVVHNGIGYRCGYVRVPVGHPWHGISDSDLNCDVHGGLTFSEPDISCDKGGPDDAWWLGFDCAHAWDAADPQLPGGNANTYGIDYGHSIVRTQEYVEAECKSLCEQAALATN